MYCNLNVIDDEYHFVCICLCYSDLRLKVGPSVNLSLKYDGRLSFLLSSNLSKTIFTKITVTQTVDLVNTNQ